MAKEKRIANLNGEGAAGEAIQIVLAARLKTMCAFRDQALNWDDPEGVHDMRVASRRLRSALSDFKPHLRQGSLPLTRLKSIARALGAVRDEDVVLAALEALKTKASAETANGIAAIVKEHQRQRARARSILKQTLKESAIGEFSDDFVNGLRTATNFPDSPGEERNHQVMTFGQLGAGIIDARLKELVLAADAIYRPLRTKKLHKLRIHAKRLRYALDLFGPCWGEEFKRSAREIARFQTSLGELHDCDAWIANLGARPRQRDSARPNRGRDAVAVWLLRHFVKERSRHYCDALMRWHQWDTKGFLDRLSEMLDGNSQTQSSSKAKNSPIKRMPGVPTRKLSPAKRKTNR